MSSKNSEIWHHFSEFDSTKAKYCYCSNIISTKSGSTGNLSRHMRIRHGHIDIYRAKVQIKCLTQNVHDHIQESNSDNLPGPSTSVSNQPTNTKSSTNIIIPIGRKNINKITNYAVKPITLLKSITFDQQLVRMIVKEFHPFTIVEDVEFIKFVKLLSPGYVLTSRKPSAKISKVCHATDFTLDVQQAERLMRKLKASKRQRCWCRVVTSTMALFFFLLSVMVVSMLLTRGKRIFGSVCNNQFLSSGLC